MTRSLLVGFALILSTFTDKALSSERNFRFCSLDESKHQDFDDIQQIWGPGRIHAEVKATAQRMRPSLFSAYTTSYIEMTQERDIARCFGDLKADDSESELIGDRLADIMSRTYISVAEKCFEDPGFDLSFSGFCQDARDIKRGDHDSLGAAMFVTATYLSSHMATALVAVIYDDLFWNQFPDSATHGLLKSPQLVLKARLRWIDRYKPYYDKNNEFLAQNFSTVARTLVNACYLRSNALENVALLAKILPSSKLVFGLVRDRTFFAARALALSLLDDPSDLPLLTRVDDQYLVDIDGYHPWTVEPPELSAIKRTARQLFLPPLSSTVFRALGGLKQQEYTDYLSKNDACSLPL